MKRAVLFAAVVCAACAVPHWSSRPRAWTEAGRLVARADDLAAQNSATEARDLYQQVVKEHPHEPAAADALWGLSQLELDPGGALYDYRAALGHLERLLAQHPGSPHEREARTWRAALRELQRWEGESTRLRADLERLKEMDMEQER